MKNIINILFLVFLTACSNSPWTKTEKTEFIDACMNEGGSKSYCKCYMENVMQQYPIKEDANQLDFETKIELSKDCN
jgi:hypothetical protein